MSGKLNVLDPRGMWDVVEDGVRKAASLDPESPGT